MIRTVLGARSAVGPGAFDHAPPGTAPALPGGAGLVKIAGDFHHLDAHARTAALGTAADAHRATGAPVALHLERGTATGAHLVNPAHACTADWK